MKYRMDWFVLIASIVCSVSCGGGGCGGCAAFEPIPGGFPSAKRTPNATQVRVSSTGFSAIAADPATLIGSLTGDGASDGILRFNAPVNCGGGTPTCCPDGRPRDPCGPINIDLKTPGAGPRLELRPVQGAAQLGVTVRARVQTENDIPVNLPVIGDCGLAIDTTAGGVDEVQIDAPINFVTDATTGTTRVQVGAVAIANLATEDVELTGGFFCDATDLIRGLLIGVLRNQLTSAVQSTIQGQTCKACPSGQVAECGSSFATACTAGVCMQGNQCFQELGLTGRVRGSALLGALSPGTTGALDLYAVAATARTDNSGLTLGLLGGMQPAGLARDRCGPPAMAPARATIDPSTFFQGNTRPDNSAAFDIALGMHRSQLAELAYAGYDGGLLCLTIGYSFAAQLSSGTLGLLAQSLGNLVESSAPMAVGVRPQSPPEIVLGKNTFVDDGSGGKRLDDPLLDLRFSAAELDFFLSVDDQWVRTFTVVSDIHLPIGLQVAGMGQLTPVIGDTSDAFTRVSIKNAEAITESPAELAALFPSLLALVLPQLSSGVGAIALPSLGGLSLDVKDITSVDNNSFLAVFANLRIAAPQAAVETRAAIADVVEPSRDVARDPKRWAAARGPEVMLELGGEGELEWSHRLDDGTWSAWSSSRRQTVRSRALWLAGTHRVEVRARQIGVPESIDVTPVVLEVAVGDRASRDAATRRARGAFHGQASSTGCTCDGGGGAGAALPLALAIALVLSRRVRRQARGLGRSSRRIAGAVWLAAIACLPGCSCGNAARCGDDCLPGEVAHGGLGRFTSIAADGERVLVATYDTLLGDLVVADATDPARPRLIAVDGVPTELIPMHDGGYRDGIVEPGPDVGAWTSIALAGGVGRVAYQDRDAGALRYAQETARDRWSSHVVDAGGGELVGAYASLVIDGNGAPAIAYIATGNDDGSGGVSTELRLARASSKDPGEGDWSITVVASAPGSCAGLCGAGLACVAGVAAGDPESCVSQTADCTPACGAGAVCSARACRTEIASPTVAQLATGTGLFASLVILPDGRLAVAYHDRTEHALKLAVETAAGSSMFAETALDASLTSDRGMWASAAVDAGGTIHLAYQDALADQLMYTTWNGAAGRPEVVDDGQRTGERTHGVGAAAAIYLVDGAPVIAYQDGLTAYVYVATRSGSSWSTRGVATGPLLDGFSIGATTGHGSPVLAWGALDPTANPVGQLVVTSP
jgi:hypothetical protein